MPRLPLCLLSLAALALLSGCFELRHTHPETTEKILSRERQVLPSGALRGQAGRDAYFLEVRAEQLCNVVEQQQVERTTTYEEDLEDSDLALVAALAGVGAVPLGFGIAILADAPNVYDTDLNTRQHNYIGQGGAIALGTVLAAIGTGMVTPGAINGLRALGTDETTTTTTRNGPILQRDVPCEEARQASGQYVTLQCPQGSYNVGSLQQGRLSVDLTQALPASLFLQQNPPQVMDVMIGSTKLGTVDVVDVGWELRQREDERLWQAAEPGACAQQLTEPACAGVRRYLGTFPDGLHAPEAKDLLYPLDQPQQVLAAEAAGEAEQRAKRLQEALQAAGEASEQAELQAQEQISQKAREACQKACAKSCAADADCRSACTSEACP